MERRLLAVLMVVLAALLAWVAIHRSRDSEADTPTSIAPSARRRSASATTLAEVAGLSPAEPESIPAAAPSSEPAREVVDAEAQVVHRVVASAGGASAAGHLVVRPIDGDTGLPLITFTVRAASETRFADESHRGPGEELDLTLTPATYAVLVTAPGYESVELPPVRVENGGRVELDGVALVPGRGRILAEVFGLPPGETVSVRLAGSGRRPCDACPAHWQGSTACPCGYAVECTTKRVDEHGLVSFDGLAHARFALQPVDEGGRALGDACELELASGDTASVELDASQSRTLEIEVVDVDGTSMAPEWSARVAREAADATSDDEPVTIGLAGAVNEHGERSTTFTLEFRRAERLVARGAFRSPALLESSFVSRRAGRASARRRTQDRARQPSDRLWPELSAPELPLVSVVGQVDERGIAVLRPLSTSELTLHATAEHFESAALVPADRATTRVRLQMQRRTDADPTSAASLRAHESGEAR